MAADETYGPLVYRDTGGDRQVIASGGKVLFEDGGILQFGDDADIVATFTSPNVIITPAVADTGALHIGNGTLDMDVKIFLGAADQYVLFDVGNAKVTFAKVDVEIDGDLTLDLEDLQLGDDQYLQFGDATGGDVYMSWISATSILTILPTTDDTGAIHIGNGTKDIDFKVFLGAADTSALFDVGNTSLTLAKVNLTFSTALDIITAANTAVALEFYDATTKYVAIDTRNTVAADMLTVTGIPATIAGASGTTRRMLNIVPGTTTLTGSTGVTNMSGIDAYFTAPTLTDSSAITVAKASTVCIAGVPAAGGSVTITSALALEILGATNFGVDAAGVDVTLFGAVTGYKVWFDANGDTNGAVYFGADTKGIMTYWYGDTTAYSVHFDPSGDTNGAWYFGADTKGIQVNLYGDITGCGVFWDPTTDTNGTLTTGGSGGSKGVDVVMYGATNGSLMQWDQSANSLILTNSTLSVTVAGLTAGDAYSGIRSVVTANNPNNSYGAAGYFETTLTGTQAGNFVYGLGSWVNMTAGTQGLYVCAQDNGIYQEAGSDISGSRVIFGMRMEAILAEQPARLCPFSINPGAALTLSALFSVEDHPQLGPVAGKNTTNLFIPLYITDDGNVRYVELFG